MILSPKKCQTLASHFGIEHNHSSLCAKQTTTAIIFLERTVFMLYKPKQLLIAQVTYCCLLQFSVELFGQSPSHFYFAYFSFLKSSMLPCMTDHCGCYNYTRLINVDFLQLSPGIQLTINVILLQ